MFNYDWIDRICEYLLIGVIMNLCLLINEYGVAMNL